jgi:hypothetical protein
MLKIGVMVVVMLVLTGCASEVDKCVDAFVETADDAFKKDKDKFNLWKLEVRLLCIDTVKK